MTKEILILEFKEKLCIKRPTFSENEEQRENYFQDITTFYKSIAIKIVWNWLRKR